MKQTLLLLSIGLLFVFYSESPAQGTWNKNLSIDSVNVFRDIECDISGNIFTSVVRQGFGAPSKFGESYLTKTDSLGNQVWSVKVEGKSSISEIVCIGNEIIIAGRASDQCVLGSDTISPNSFFMSRLFSSGQVNWLIQSDTLNGYYAQLAPAVNGDLVATVFSATKSYLLRFSSSGSKISDKLLPGLSVSDIDVDDMGNFYLAGSVFTGGQIDTLTVSPPFSYSNYTLKFSPDLIAQWARYSEHSTASFHHRVEVLHNRPVVFNLIGASISADPTLISYNADGSVHKSKVLHSNVFQPTGEISAYGDHLASVHDVYNYSDPAVLDTFHVNLLDTALNIVETHEINGNISVAFSNNPQQLIENDRCHFVVGSIHYNDTLFYDGDPNPGIHDFTNVSLVRKTKNACDELTSLKNHVAEEMQTKVYPNPFSDQLNIQFDAPRSGVYQMINSLGAVVYAQEFTDVQSLTTSALMQSGMYFLVIHHKNGEMESHKLYRE